MTIPTYLPYFVFAERQPPSSPFSTVSTDRSRRQSGRQRIARERFAHQPSFCLAGSPWPSRSVPWAPIM